MFILVEQWFFFLLEGLSVIGIILLIAVIAAWLRAPDPLKSFFWCWIKHKITDICFTDDQVGDILPKDIGPEGQLRGQVKRLQRKFKDFKITPRSKHKIFDMKAFWRGSGIPLTLSYSGKAIATNPLVLALIEILGSQKKAMQFFKGESIQIDPKKIKDFFESAYDESQFQNLIEEAYQEGREDERKPFSAKLAIPIGLVVIGIIIVFVLSQGGLF